VRQVRFEELYAQRQQRDVTMAEAAEMLGVTEGRFAAGVAGMTRGTARCDNELSDHDKSSLGQYWNHDAYGEGRESFLGFVDRIASMSFLIWSKTDSCSLRRRVKVSICVSSLRTCVVGSRFSGARSRSPAVPPFKESGTGCRSFPRCLARA